MNIRNTYNNLRSVFDAPTSHRPVRAAGSLLGGLLLVGLVALLLSLAVSWISHRQVPARQSVLGQRRSLSSGKLIAFDELTPDQPLDGYYPDGTIDWSRGEWVVLGPEGRQHSNSIGFDPARSTMSSLTFTPATVLVSLAAYNRGSDPTVLTLECAGLPRRSITLAPGQLQAIQTGWSSPCTFLMISSTNGANTSFDDFQFQ